MLIYYKIYTRLSLINLKKMKKNIYFDVKIAKENKRGKTIVKLIVVELCPTTNGATIKLSSRHHRLLPDKYSYHQDLAPEFWKANEAKSFWVLD